MQQRYFIGITLPDELSSTINKIQHDLFQPGKTMQPLVPHITLLHPNMLESLTPKKLIPNVKLAADEMLPISIRLSEINMFDKRVIYIAVQCSKIIDLYEKLFKQLPAGVREKYQNDRKFNPHVTLTQSKPRQNLDSVLVQRFNKQVSPLLPQTFQAKNLSKFIWQSPRTYKIIRI
jgi:2'-5' RNA ligase